MKTNKFLFIGLLIFQITISGCSSTPADSGNVGDTGSTAIFADNRELDYMAGATDYRIGSSDLLDIKVFQAEELSREVRVDPQGNITLPLLGNIKAAGQTQSGLEQQLASLMRKNMLQNPQVSVFIKENTAQRVTVEGQVKKPGVYPIAGQATILQSIAMAEGLSELAAADKVVLFRNSGQHTKAYQLNLTAIRDGKARDPYVRNDDRIVVHRSDSRFWVRETAALLSPFSVLNRIVN